MVTIKSSGVGTILGENEVWAIMGVVTLVQ
jgi:hypothetical protein